MLLFSTSIASQMWCLGRFLPLHIGSLVPEGDRFWDNYLMLLTIMDYVFAPLTTPAKADYVPLTSVCLHVSRGSLRVCIPSNECFDLIPFVWALCNVCVSGLSASRLCDLACTTLHTLLQLSTNPISTQ